MNSIGNKEISGMFILYFTKELTDFGPPDQTCNSVRKQESTYNFVKETYLKAIILKIEKDKEL
jgi:hypothetical protein